MAELTDADLDAALMRGRQAREREVRARTARYDSDTARVVVELSNGCSFAFPARSAQGLETATDALLSRVELLGAGSGLRWDELDVDLSVPDLLAGLFGTRSHMARLAGHSTSPAKADAARLNGAKGGRPKLARV